MIRGTGCKKRWERLRSAETCWSSLTSSASVFPDLDQISILPGCGDWLVVQVFSGLLVGLTLLVGLPRLAVFLLGSGWTVFTTPGGRTKRWHMAYCDQ